MIIHLDSWIFIVKRLLKPADIVKKKLKKADFSGVAKNVDRNFAEGFGAMLVNMINTDSSREGTRRNADRRKSSENRKKGSESKKKSSENKKKSVNQKDVKDDVDATNNDGMNFFLNLLKNPEGDETPNKQNKKGKKSDSDLEMSLLGNSKQ